MISFMHKLNKWNAVRILLAVALPAVPAACQVTDQYKLGSEDVITVTVMSHPELSGDFLVTTDGAVNVQRVGQIAVAGKTAREVASAVAAGLKDTLLDPDVIVTVKTMRPQLVQALGAVQKPGPYSIKPGWRLTEVIGGAGGILATVQPADCTVQLLRAKGGARESFPLTLVLQGGEKNVLVQAGDVVTVESVETIPVYVMGRVRLPGMYNLRRDAGVAEAIAMAGGSSDDASLSQVTVTHLAGQTETVDVLTSVEQKKPISLKLRSGDLLFVPENKARFAVLGWVATPGFFTLKEGQPIMLSDALSMAGGADAKRGGLKKIGIVRRVDGKEQRLVFDFSKFTKSGDATQNPRIQAGDFIWVPETSSPDWDRLWSRISGTLSALWFLK